MDRSSGLGVCLTNHDNPAKIGITRHPRGRHRHVLRPNWPVNVSLSWVRASTPSTVLQACFFRSKKTSWQLVPRSLPRGSWLTVAWKLVPSLFRSIFPEVKFEIRLTSNIDRLTCLTYLWKVSEVSRDTSENKPAGIKNRAGCQFDERLFLGPVLDLSCLPLNPLKLSLGEWSEPESEAESKSGC